jgi:Ca2+-dependent lipid-binding protein
MHGSILTVHVVEARDLKPMDMDGTSDPYVVLQIEDQRIETNYKKSTLSPVWNESFTFDIMHGKDPLQVIVMDKDTFGNDEFQGKCFVSLSILRDQMKHD